MTLFGFTIGVLFLAAATLFVVGLHLMRLPSTARRGNRISAGGMGIAVLATFVSSVIVSHGNWLGWLALVAGTAAGGAFGIVRARTVKMTEIPQLVSIFNAVGGGAAAAVAFADFLQHAAGATPLGLTSSVPIVLDVVIGSITFSGSLIAAGKLQGIVSGGPITFPGARIVNLLVIAVALVAGVFAIVVGDSVLLLVTVLVASLLFGVLMVLPIGGADAPVIVSLLNALTGLAVAMAGFAIGNQALIIAGALVGAAGTILTLQMAKAMNRSVAAIVLGGFGTGDSTSPTATDAQDLSTVHAVSADDVAVRLAYAQHVMIVPGYGLAAGQAQHEVAELAKLLMANDIDVKYAIHPVAGRMPGHMNVLLAEANVPYDQMLQLDEANIAFADCDVALVVGANDVYNPDARKPGNAVSGMPILDVDHAKSVVILKRSMRPGYAGISNPLFTDVKTGMYFADAKVGLAAITAAAKEYVTA
jgi:proton-translocating NAD(P)+ transhydrogenase subunit beta